MKFFNKAGRLFDHAINISATLAGALVVFVLVAILYEVVNRYFFGRAILWTYEVVEFTLLYITFLATAWLLKEEAHVKIDLVLQQLKPKSQAILNVITSLICAIAFLIIIVYSITSILESIELGLFTPTELETPKHYVMLCIPFGGILLFIQFLRRSYRYYQVFKNSDNEYKP